MKIYLSKICFIVSLLAVTCWSAALAQSSGVAPGNAGGTKMSSQSPAQVWTENFESGTPSNWEFIDGASVVQSGQGNVLAFSSAGIAAWYVQPGGDFTLSLRIRQGGGAPEIMLSLAGDPPNDEYYIVRLFPDEAEVVKGVGSQQSSLGFVGGSGIGAGTWTSLEISMSGGGRSIAVSAGGQPLLTVQDPQPLKPGIIAFRAVSKEGGTEIDDLVLTPGSVSSGSQTVQPSKPVQ